MSDGSRDFTNDITDLAIIAAMKLARRRVRYARGGKQREEVLREVGKEMVDFAGSDVYEHLPFIFAQAERYYKQRVQANTLDSIDVAAQISTRRIHRRNTVSGTTVPDSPPTPIPTRKSEREDIARIIGLDWYLDMKAEKAETEQQKEPDPPTPHPAKRRVYRRRIQPQYAAPALAPSPPSAVPAIVTPQESSKALPGRRSGWIVALALVIVPPFLWFVWPTPYRYFKDGSDNMRVNRFTDKVQHLKYSGWSDP